MCFILSWNTGFSVSAMALLLSHHTTGSDWAQFQFWKEWLHPTDFCCSMRECLVLCFASRLGYNFLLLWAPRYWIPYWKDAIPTSWSPIISVSWPVNISVCCNFHSSCWSEIETMVYSSFEVFSYSLTPLATHKLGSYTNYDNLLALSAISGLVIVAHGSAPITLSYTMFCLQMLFLLHLLQHLDYTSNMSSLVWDFIYNQPCSFI